MDIINEVIIRLFVDTDNRNWLEVEKCFAGKVLLDYSSMNGSPAIELTPQQIITAWKGILPGFNSTHHQLGNFISKIETDKASVSCYGTASHYLPSDNGNLWIVVGSYDFDLIKDGDGNWKINRMKFNFKYQDGNTSLSEKAMANLK